MSWFKDKFEDATGIDLPDVDPLGNNQGLDPTSTITNPTKAGKKAWHEMTTYGGDLWEKGGAAVTDIWQGTGMEDMAAKWTDPQAMKDAWMPGKWAADSPFQSKWMMGMDMLKHREGFTMSDFQQFRQNLFEEFDRWESAANTNIASGNEGIENIIDENTDSLNDLESGINTTVSDAVDNLETNVEGLANIADSGVSLINLAGDITHQGLDASINTNNPNALITNPQGWWDNNISGLRRGDVFFKGEDALDTMASKGGDVLSDVFEPMYDTLGGLTGEVGQLYVDFGTSLGSQFMPGPTVAGDPFALGDKSRRRDILEQRTFKDRGGGTAQSLINKMA